MLEHVKRLIRAARGAAGPRHVVGAASLAATATVGTPSIQLSSSFNWRWLEIALAAETRAIDARKRSVALPTTDPAFSQAITDELDASLVGISACAHAIDALYGAIQPPKGTQLVTVPSAVVQAWADNRTKRPSRIFETLKAGCTLGNRTKTWPKEFKWLYTLRDQAVHHVAAFNTPVRHPTGKTDVAKETAEYVVESLDRAINLAIGVSVITIENAKSAQPLYAWAQERLHVATALRALRPQATL